MLSIALVLAGCTPHRPPPPNRTFDGLPVTGSLAFAQKAGFTRCISDPVSMRCRRPGVMFQGQGPYEAAVDLVGSDGNGGFDQLILWHDEDQYAVQAVGDALERKGWKVCLTGNDNAGDQEIYSRSSVPLIVSIDISYWAKRRLRLIPKTRGTKPAC
jgi:hypothetical protein